MNTKILSMKKYIISLLLMIFFVFAFSCDDSDEVTPRDSNTVRSYVMPRAKALTEGDRTEVNQRQKEYEDSL